MRHFSVCFARFISFYYDMIQTNSTALEYDMALVSEKRRLVFGSAWRY